MFYRPHNRVQHSCGDVVMTKQSHKEECDIYRILKQYQRTGIITHVQSARPTYDDLPSSLDFQTSLNLIMEAEQAFSALPAKVRDHYSNDPGRFLAAFADPKEADRLREFGLLKPLPPASPPEGATGGS